MGNWAKSGTGAAREDKTFHPYVLAAQYKTALCVEPEG
jgi:hypothetical protein